MFSQGGRGTLEDNEIFGNQLHGVDIRDGSNPTLRTNRIHENMKLGVLVCQESRGTLEDNEICGNKASGVEIRENSDPTLRRNTITKNGERAVHVHRGGAGTIEDNDLRGNAHGAWFVDTTSGNKLTVVRNRE